MKRLSRRLLGDARAASARWGAVINVDGLTAVRCDNQAGLGHRALGRGSRRCGRLRPRPDEARGRGSGNLLGKDAESLRAGEALRVAWPDQAYESLAVAALHRPGGLTAADLGYAKRLAERIEEQDRPKAVLRVLGPDSPPEVAAAAAQQGRNGRARGRDPFDLVRRPGDPRGGRLAPVADAGGSARPPEGLEVRWAGDAMIGRDYMAGVQTSLDRAAMATVVLLLGVLLAVYRSAWLALVPLATIGISLVISRSVLAWMNLAGWEVSPLVELFLVALLFGSGTDFCLFVSWRFGEHWEAGDPARAMRATMERSFPALLTSAGTVIVGLSLMGTTRFKLFSSTGPSVAIGLAITLAASMTLTPALSGHPGPSSPAIVRGPDGPVVGLVGTHRPQVARPSGPSWLATVLCHGSPGDSGPALGLHSGRDDRDAAGNRLR